jgi:large subunit ribosomal protein L10
VALALTDKQKIVEKLRIIAMDSASLVLAEYRGLTSANMTKLRSQAREMGVTLIVARNNLARRALVDSEFSSIDKELVGPLVLAFSKDDPAAAARLFKKFVKEIEKLNVTCLSLGGQTMPGSQLDTVASLPTKEQALGMLVSVLQAPVTKLVRTMAETYTTVVRVVAAIRDQKERG